MNGKVVIGCDLDTRSFDAQIDYVESQMKEIEHKLEQADMGFEVGDTQKLEADYERFGIKLDNLRKKQTQLNQEQAQMNKLDLSGVQTGIDNVNKGLQNTVKRVAKWGIALFGIRSAYSAIRSAMSTLSQYDDQITSNIEYIKYALANTLQPLIQNILNLVVKLLQYINYIAKAWTGKDLFKTADAFKSAQKNAQGLNKELSKTTASFDEMNILSDTPSSVGGNADISAPNIDLTGMQGEVPQWLKWIVDNKDLILAVMSGVAAGLLAWKLGLSGIQSLGIGLAISGIVYTIESLLEYLKDPSWENFGKIITGIGIAVAGVAIIFGAWPVAIAGAIAAVVGLIVSNWEKIKSFALGIGQWLEERLGIFGEMLNTAIKDGLSIFETLFGGVKQILDGIIKIFNGDFKSGIELAIKGIGNIIISVLNVIINAFNLFTAPFRGLIVAVGKITGKNWTMDNVKVPLIPKLAKGGIINQPGRGVPIGYGQAIGGENRAEGVIPLTDSQQMQLLGEAIGRYVTINANITNTMNGRVISRELQKVNNTNDFAFNR